MESSFNNPQASCHKVKNILVRHSCSKTAYPDSEHEHPETAYILKYAPKYYKNLTLQAKTQSQLLTKVKKIKKLKTFTGYFGQNRSEKHGFNLLANNRKDIEEPPYFYCKKMQREQGVAYWKRLGQEKLKYFWNVKRIWLPVWDHASVVHHRDHFLSCKERFVRHLWNLRKLKSVKMQIRDGNLNDIMWILGKMNNMDGLFKRLEGLTLNLILHQANPQELFEKNKIVFSHVTGLHINAPFYPIFAEIPEMCKKLDSFSFFFHSKVDNESSDIRNLFTGMQKLTELKNLGFSWPWDAKNFWSQFKPQSSLEILRLSMNAEFPILDGLFEEDKVEDIVAHWEEIKDLKALEFAVTSVNDEQFQLMKMLLTKVLKKVQKLEALKIYLGTNVLEETLEPFFVEEVPHLYGTLKKFVSQYNNYPQEKIPKFDLKLLKPFKHLISLKIEGNTEINEDLEEVVNVLQGNEREGVLSNLEFKLWRTVGTADWLQNTLRILERTKKPEENLKIALDLKFGRTEGCVEIIEGLCAVIASVRTIKDLRIHIDFHEENVYGDVGEERLAEVGKIYDKIRNVSVRVSNDGACFEWVRVDGEKEQIHF